jgi:hypothetical protein
MNADFPVTLIPLDIHRFEQLNIRNGKVLWDVLNCLIFKLICH